MTKLGHRLQGAARRIWRWFFPAEEELPEALAHILSFVFPRLDRRTLSFHRGFPHLLNLFPNQAITLPAGLRPGRTRVYVHPAAWDPGSVRGLGLLVHETYHALQVQETWRGRGLGLFHPFITLYLACAAANRFRYDGHPMETDAYRVAGLSHSLFEAALDPSTIPDELRPAPRGGSRDLAPFEACCNPAVTAESGIAFWQKLAASTPGWRLLAAAAGALLGPPGASPLRRAVAALPAAGLLAAAGLLTALWLTVWAAAAAVLAVSRLLVEGLGALAAGALWALGGLALLLGRLAPAR